MLVGYSTTFEHLCVYTETHMYPVFLEDDYRPTIYLSIYREGKFRFYYVKNKVVYKCELVREDDVFVPQNTKIHFRLTNPCAVLKRIFGKCIALSDVIQSKHYTMLFDEDDGIQSLEYTLLCGPTYATIAGAVFRKNKMLFANPTCIMLLISENTPFIGFVYVYLHLENLQIYAWGIEGDHVPTDFFAEQTPSGNILISNSEGPKQYLIRYKDSYLAYFAEPTYPKLDIDRAIAHLNYFVLDEKIYCTGMILPMRDLSR